MDLHLWIFFAKPCHRARQHVAAECKHGQHREPVRCLTVAQIGRETLHFIETTAVISGDKLRPDADGNYDLGQIGWCFIETDRWG